MSKSTVLPNLRSGIFVSAVAGLFAVAGMPLAVAQDAADEEVEEIVVTGTYLKRTQSDMASPITILDSETMAEIGANSLPDLVNSLTINTGAQIYVNNLDQPRSAGTTNINLRGLGESSTLVLLNGTRNTLTPAVTQSGDQFVDLSVLVPMIAVERVEILKDGASSLYGSDAVAGVVNFITRDNFEGLEFKFEASDNEHGGDQLDFGIILGGRHERGNFMAAFEYLSVRPVTNGERWPDYRDTQNSITGFGNPSNVFGGPVRLVDPECSNVGNMLEPGLVFDAFLCRLRYGFYGNVVSDEERMQGYASGSFEFSDSAEFFLEMTFARNEAIIGSVPTQPMTNPVYVPEDHPDIINIFAAGIADPYAGVTRTNPDNGNLREVQWFGRVRGGGFPQNPDLKPFDGWRSKGGFRGEINDTWDYTFSFAYSINETAAGRTEAHQVNLQNALYGRGGPNQDEFYHFAWSAQDQNSQEVLDSVLGFYGYQAESTQKVFDGIVSGELFEMGGGTVGAAFGVQWREDTLEYDYNDLSEQFVFSFFIGGSDYKAEQQSTAVFGELAFPFSDNFELNVSARWEEIESESTFDPKVSFLFTPTEQWSIRASWGTSFRVPSLFTTGGPFFDAGTGVDPQTGLGGEGITYRAEFRVNPDAPPLVPQEATTINVGATYSHPNGLTASLDYWSFDFEDFITFETTSAILATDTDPANPHPQVIRDEDGGVVAVIGFAANAGFIETDGIDFSISYAFNTNRAGTFTPFLDSTYILSYDIDDPTIGPLDAVGVRNLGNIGAPSVELRANFGVRWAMDNHSANIVARYIDDYLSDSDPSPNGAGLPDPADWYPIGSMTVIDAQYSIALPDLFGADTYSKIRLGAKNIAGKIAVPTPGVAGYDERVHDPRGRYIYLNLVTGF